MKKLYVNIAALVLSLFVFGAALYAWFSATSPFYNISFELGNVNVNVKVLVGQDFNHDGYVDVDADGNDVYNELTANAWSGKLVPTKIYTYKVEGSGETSNLSVTIGGVTSPELQRYLAFRSGTVLADVLTASFTPSGASSFIVYQNLPVTDASVSLWFQLCLLPYDGAITEAQYQAVQTQTANLTLTISATTV